jgi:hypothetical protein
MKLLTHASGLVAHVDLINSEGGVLSTYPSASAFWNAAAPTESVSVTAEVNDYDSLSAAALVLLGDGWAEGA